MKILTVTEKAPEIERKLKPGDVVTFCGNYYVICRKSSINKDGKMNYKFIIQPLAGYEPRITVCEEKLKWIPPGTILKMEIEV